MPDPINIITGALRGAPNQITQGLVGVGLLPPQWGLFDNKSGKSVILFTSVKDVDYRKDWSVLNYPIESGSFESYNKVETPYEARITFMAGGFAASQDLINSALAVAGNLKLYDVVTPEKTFTRANINHVDFRRHLPTGLLELSVFLVQIRNNVSSELSTSSAQQPAGAATADGGQVQPTDIGSDPKVIAAFNAPETAPPAAVLGNGPS